MRLPVGPEDVEPITEPEPVITEPEPVATEPEPEPEPSVEPEPVSEPSAEPEPEPEPEPSAEPEPAEGEYSDAEWNAMTPEAQEAVWAEYNEAEAKAATEREKELAEREKKLKKAKAELEKSKAESDRVFHERMGKVTELSKEKGVESEYGEFKKDQRIRKKDPSAIFNEITIDDVIPNAKTQQERTTNATVKSLVRKSLQAVGKAIGPDLNFIQGLREIGERGKRVLEDDRLNKAAWVESIIEIQEAEGLELDDEVIEKVGAQIEEEEMTAFGRRMSTKARTSILRRILKEVSDPNATAKPASGKVLHFPKKPPKTVAARRKPPRRPPSTMGTRGGTSNRPEPHKRSLMGDLAAGVEID